MSLHARSADDNEPSATASACLRDQHGQPHQIADGGSEGKSPCDAIAATEAGLLLNGDRLDPAECLLNALAISATSSRTVSVTAEIRFADTSIP
jgi:hypothetical protein